MAKILIVEDDVAMREALRRALERCGYTVNEATDGYDAVRKLGSPPPDLVVTDLIMPDREGLETIQYFRQRFPTMPIIAISGGGCADPNEYLAVAGHFGANRTFAKPFRIQEFLGAVVALTSRSAPA